MKITNTLARLICYTAYLMGTQFLQLEIKKGTISKAKGVMTPFNELWDRVVFPEDGISFDAVRMRAYEFLFQGYGLSKEGLLYLAEYGDGQTMQDLSLNYYSQKETDVFSLMTNLDRELMEIETALWHVITSCKDQQVV